MKAARAGFLLVLAAWPLAARGYDVRQFGAKGGFQTNDRAAMQAAIDACNRDGGGTVNVPQADAGAKAWHVVSILKWLWSGRRNGIRHGSWTNAWARRSR